MGGEANLPYAGNVEANRRDPDPKHKAVEELQLFGDPVSGTEGSGFAAAPEEGSATTQPPESTRG